MNYEEFVDKYKPIKNTFTEGSAFDDTMFETYGNEYEFIKNLIDEGQGQKIWTYVCEGDSEVIVAGWHFVNRMGYFVTEELWETDDEFVEL